MAIKRNEVLIIHATTEMNLGNITLSERKDCIFYDSTYMKCAGRIGTSIKTESRTGLEERKTLRENRE